ncbi:pseudouridine synthase [Blattabacterium punctulatus]|uniref:pseudouridine synthase n=1 Tax=Blattabacterium punctulatus TaxID=164514 RepID=UPI000D7BBB62|nr:pseudouridine synthase [Blattabacterium punctulatus]AWU45206.1 rRNA pseudouridine synthase [Blattabacterium punctulatus]
MNNIQNKKNKFIRLNHYLSNSGISSRRDADKLIQSGIVKVNGIPVTKLGTVIHVNDVIKLNGNKIKKKNNIYILLNKPKGFITSTHDPFNRKTVMSLIPNFSNYRIFPVGRLDRSTTGVLLLTNDGFITEKLTHPKYNVKKIYHVLLNKKIHDEDIYKIKKGKIFLREGRVKIDFIYREQKNRIKIGLHIGWNRVIKRIFKKLTYKVVQLDRINFGGLTKKNIKIGCWNFLNKNEIDNTVKNFFYEKN